MSTALALALAPIALTAVVANDTHAPTYLKVGQTFESAAWRIHRYDGSFTAVELRAAGKRGAQCLKLTFVEYGRDPSEPLAAALRCAAQNGSAAEMRAVVAATVEGAGWYDTTIPAREVPRPGEVVRVDGAKVRGTFTATGFRLTFTAEHRRPDGSTFKNDYGLRGLHAAQGRKALAWARANVHHLDGMSRLAVHDALAAAGVAAG